MPADQSKRPTKVRVGSGGLFYSRQVNTYYLKLAGPKRERHHVQAADLDEARNAAIRHLGSYLSAYPEFADEGHWRLDVETETGQVLATVIVATVVPRKME